MKSSKKWWIGLGIVLSYIFIVGFFFTNKMMYIKKKTDEDILDREVKDGHYDQKKYDAYRKQDISIPSSFGYYIKGHLIEPNETNRYIIICHGVTMNRFNSVKYMNIFLERGFNVLLYDHRRHGESGGKTTSYGHYEKFDLQAVVGWLKEYVGEDLTLGIHGESMGAVTTLLYGSMVEDGADFYIADCPFADLEEQLRYRLKIEFRLPAFLVMPIAKAFLKLRDGYTFRDVSPIQVIDRIHKPILFVHSKDDDYIPLQSSELLFEKKIGLKKLYVAEKGTHAMSYTENREQYEKIIDEFLEEVNGIKN
ncbi:alpha/beta hydrolase [Metabacillus arenae]|uniref:Alpha/beta hydrolase n=1 Tax=Metabacillus arenae TaxID=2771434 RepID=A0A926NCL1_9BACI|nr:alpha/beta hydrolase [Metabacillus arenae]MBD1378731.1 alpha/beta hydrolase [Metabacillus arenae]